MVACSPGKMLILLAYRSMGGEGSARMQQSKHLNFNKAHYLISCLRTDSSKTSTTNVGTSASERGLICTSETDGVFYGYKYSLQNKMMHEWSGFRTCRCASPRRQAPLRGRWGRGLQCVTHRCCRSRSGHGELTWSKLPRTRRLDEFNGVARHLVLDMRSANQVEISVPKMRSVPFLSPSAPFGRAALTLAGCSYEMEG